MQNFNDEELLSYLLGDCCFEKKKQIKARMESDPEIKKRLSFLENLREQMQIIPIETYSGSRNRRNYFLSWQRLIPRYSLIFLAFFLGIFIQSQFEIFSHHRSESTFNSSYHEISEPLNWDPRKINLII